MPKLTPESGMTTRRRALTRLMTFGLVGATLTASKGQAEQVASSRLADQNAITSLLTAYAAALDEGRVADCAE